MDELLPNLEELIQELAKRYGWRTRRETKRELAKAMEVPDKLWERVVAVVREQAAVKG